MKYGIIFDTDSYKASHYLQYPTGTTSIYSYIESRGGDYPETVFFGLQYYLKEYLARRVTVDEVERAAAFFKAHGEPFNYDGWMYIAKDLGGKIPVRIKAVPEGTVVPTHNLLVSVESTDPKVCWITSWIETSLLRAIWYPTTVATRSFTIKQIIMNALNKSSDDPESEINFKLHDFSGRGISSQETAMVGGAAHLINFMGSDTVAGILCANEYYNCSMSGFSIPASEHSSITSWGKDNEVEAYRNMLKQFAKPGTLVACVSDSYDLYNAISNLWGTVLKQDIIDSGAILVVRPDSGNPPDIVLQSLKLLDEKFGHTINSKGYKVLNYVKVIQGDGVNEVSIQEILDVALNAGYSATNIGFGCGGYLAQSMTRDTLKFAMKCSSITVNGEERDVFKDPITDHGKASKKGKLDLVANQIGILRTIRQNEFYEKYSIMHTVFENGELLIDDSLDAIRKRTLCMFIK